MKIAVSGYKCLNDINEFVEIRDITLITGKNSSGKSSFSEVYDFFTKFSNLAFGKTSLYDWFDLKINHLIFPNMNKFFSGIDKNKQSFEIGITGKEDIRLNLTFKFDENGFNIVLQCVELKNSNEVIFSISKNKEKPHHNFRVNNEGFSLISNIGPALNYTNPRLEKILSLTRDYIEYYKNETQKKLTDQNIFDQWFNIKYIEPEFYELIKNKNHLTDFLLRNSFLELTPSEYEKIINQINTNSDFRFWVDDYDFPENLWWKLYLCQHEIGKRLKEKFQVRFFSKVIHLFENREFMDHMLKFSDMSKLDSIFEFKLDKTNEIFFSESEIKHLELEWKNQLFMPNTSNVCLHDYLLESLISFNLRFSGVEKFFNETNNKNKTKYLISINIDKKESCFPEANTPLDSFYRNLFDLNGELTPNLEGELWYEKCKEHGVYPKNIWQAYLFLEYQILSAPRIAGDSLDNKAEWVEIELQMNEQFALSSLSFEMLGKIAIEDFIQNNETELGLINGNNFQAIWDQMNSKQRIAFEKTFNSLRINEISLNDILQSYADGKSIIFINNTVHEYLEILLDEGSNKVSHLNSLGSGHQNIINIALEFVYYFVCSVFSNKKHLNVILVEPERFLHPNQSSSMVQLIYFFTLFKNVKIENITRISPDINLIIETHSEYLIRSFQEQIAQFKDSNGFNESFTVNYFEKNENSNITSIRQIFIEKDGSLSDEFGSGFLDETELIIRSLLNARLK
jgi:hypothetical protein